MKPLPTSSIPPELSERVRDIGRMWASSELRPRISASIKNHWDALIDEWIASDLPIAIRKSGGARGGSVTHQSGRKLILADNSPAQWAFARAYAGASYSLSEICDLLDKDEMPFAYATKSAEKSQMRYACTLSGPDNVNKRGWKLCHIDDVGLNARTKIEELPWPTLANHFRLLLRPSNHFLVPLEWAGLGEMPEVIAEIRNYESDVQSMVAG
jgi:hypothetical protein